MFESTPIIGFTSSAFWAAAAWIGVYAGVIVDRISNVTDALRRVALCGLGISIGAAVSSVLLEDYWLVFVLALFVILLQVVGGFVSALALVVIPTVLHKGQIASAQSLITTVGVVANVATPVVAAWFVSREHLEWGLVLQCGVMVCALASFVGVHISIEKSPRTKSFLLELRDGWVELWSNNLMRLLTLAGIMNAITGGVLPVVYLEISQVQHGLTPDSVFIAGFAVAATVGSVLGNIALPFLRKVVTPVNIAKWGLLFVSLSMVVFVVSPTVAVAIVVYGIWQMAYGLVIINAIAFRMEVVPPELLGRVGTIARLIAWGASPIGALLVGLGSNFVSVQYICLAAAVFPLFGVFMFYIVNRKSRVSA